MTVTLPYAQEQFDRFNELIFSGKLPSIPIQLTRAGSFLGRLCYVRRRTLLGRKANTCFTMRLSTSFDLPEDEIQDVIIHEMIHLYIASNNLRDTSTHGQIFRSMMNDINSRYGRHVTIRVNVKPAVQPRKKPSGKKHYVCVSTFTDGKQGLTVCSEQMYPRIKNSLKRVYHLQDCQWYITSDPFFDTLPHSRKPRIYRIARMDEAMSILSPTAAARTTLRSGRPDSA